MKHDYLKYWRVIRSFVKAKYGLTQADLDVLLFLYSEQYFTKDRFEEFDKLLSWDVNRFDHLLRDGWIALFRQRLGRKKAIYELSFKTKRLIDMIYKKLSGDEIPVDSSSNPMFAKNVSYTDKRYRNMIMDMNKFTRDKRKNEKLQ